MAYTDWYVGVLCAITIYSALAWLCVRENRKWRTHRGIPGPPGQNHRRLRPVTSYPLYGLLYADDEESSWPGLMRTILLGVGVGMLAWLMKWMGFADPIWALIVVGVALIARESNWIGTAALMWTLVWTSMVVALWVFQGG